MKRKVTLRQYLDALNIIGGGRDINVDGIDGIAVESPVQELTDEGLKHFSPCLDLIMDGDTVTGTDEDYDRLYEFQEEDTGDGGKLQLAWEYLTAMAGYCSTGNYDKWFRTNEE